MIVSGWYDGHSTYGLRVQEANVSLFFRPEWETVTVYLPDETDPVIIPLTASFWEGSPELRSPRIKSFFATGSSRGRKSSLRIWSWFRSARECSVSSGSHPRAGNLLFHSEAERLFQRSSGRSSGQTVGLAAERRSELGAPGRFVMTLSSP